MTGPTIEVDDRKVLDVLQELVRRSQHLEPVMRDIGARLESNVQERFAAKVDPNGIQWKKWADSTDRHHNGRGSILEMYRDMLNSLSYQADDDSVLVGFGSPYAIYHEFGAKSEREARSATVYFKQSKDGTVGNRFVKKNKSNFAQNVTIGAHTVELPRRGMLTADPNAGTLGAEDERMVLDILHEYFSDALHGK